MEEDLGAPTSPRLNGSDSDLDLALCRKVAENHRGSLEVAGSEAETSFTILLPLRQE